VVLDFEVLARVLQTQLVLDVHELDDLGGAQDLFVFGFIPLDVAGDDVYLVGQLLVFVDEFDPLDGVDDVRALLVGVEALVAHCVLEFPPFAVVHAANGADGLVLDFERQLLAHVD